MRKQEESTNAIARAAFLAAVILSVNGCFLTPVDQESADVVAYQHADNLYDTASSVDEYLRAIDLFEAVIDEYPYGDKVDNSQYLIGRSYLAIGGLLADSALRSAYSDSLALVQKACGEYLQAPEQFDRIDQRSNQYVYGRYYRIVARAGAAKLGDPSVSFETVRSELENFRTTYPQHRMSRSDSTDARYYSEFSWLIGR